MARNGSGSFSLVAGNPVTTGTQITATWANNTLSDIASEITGSVAADGQTTITGPIKFSAGSVYAPAMTFSSETNTGFYRSGAGVVSMSIAGSQKYIFGASSVTLGGSASITGTEFGYLTGVTSAIQGQIDGKEPHTALLTALGAQTTAANNVQAYSGAATPTLLSTGTSSGNIPLVGTSSATEALAGLVELATTAEASAGTDTSRAVTAAGITAALTARTASFGSVWVGTSNGYGSTNTAIRRFSTTHMSQGADITYTDSATNGASFTINTDGMYSISYTDSFAGAGDLGVSLNSAQLTTGVASITAADRLTMCTTAAGSYRDNCSVTVPLSAGDIIRPHAGASGGGTAPTNAHFTITRVA